MEDHYRSRLRELAAFDADPHDPPDEPAVEPRIEESLDDERLYRRTRAVLDSLPELYSMALLWRYWEKRSAQEMAAATGRTEKAIERILAARGSSSSGGGAMSDRFREDAFFEKLAGRTEAHRETEAPADLKARLADALAGADPLFTRLAAAREEEPAPSRLKCLVYSALVARQQESGPLLSLSETRAAGRSLCVFEELVRIAPVGERLDSFNYCRVCHARVLASTPPGTPPAPGLRPVLCLRRFLEDLIERYRTLKSARQWNTSQLSAPGFGDRMEPRLAVIFRGAPLRTNPALGGQPQHHNRADGYPLHSAGHYRLWVIRAGSSADKRLSSSGLPGQIPSFLSA